MNKKALDIFTVVAILSMVATFDVYNWFHSQGIQNHGPALLQVGDDRILVSDSESLYELNKQGELLRATPLYQLMVTQSVIDLQLLGNGDVLIADTQQRIIQHCNTSAETASCEKLSDVSALTGGLFKFHPDE